MILVLVDGSNVARCAEWRVAAGTQDDMALRRGLVDAVCSWAPGAEARVDIVFDGAGPWRAGKVSASPEVRVIGSGRAEGDDVLERRAANAHRARERYWLVTSDRALQEVAGARAERILDADAFVAGLGAPAVDRSQAAVAGSQPGTRLSETLDADVRARLERLRRGEGGPEDDA